MSLRILKRLTVSVSRKKKATTAYKSAAICSAVREVKKEAFCFATIASVVETTVRKRNDTSSTGSTHNSMLHTGMIQASIDITSK
jgi:hypothetical protein